MIELEVEGMDCNNCAASIERFLERKGLEDVYVNFSTKEVRFKLGDTDLSREEVVAGINRLGYQVVEEEAKAEKSWTLEKKLVISAIFTLPLLLQHLVMVAGIHPAWFDNYWLQLGICLPPFIIGFLHFGRSALSSVRGGVPNMDVLIFIGSTAAFVYSLIGTLLQDGDLIFYETSATIITLVLLGNWLEKRAVQQTTSAIEDLTRLQVECARKIMPSGTVIEIDKNEIEKGDILQVNEGDKIPADGVITKGKASIDESMLTGESVPVEKEAGDEVIGASLLSSGNIQMEVTATGSGSILGRMIELVKTAQREKPPIQRLADRISAVFVPVVLAISLLTLLLGHWAFDLSFQQALMNAIAVLVISCPCAMGLATPTAVMVGVGRLAKNGILIRGGDTVERFTKVDRMVFDKTGTLTTGRFRIQNIQYHNTDEKTVNALVYKLEQHSSHPIADSLVREMQDRLNGLNVDLQEVKEEKGVGVMAVDEAGNDYKIGSGRILSEPKNESGQWVYLTKNGDLMASIELADELKEDASDTIRYLKRQGFHPVIISGDSESKTAEVAAALEIEEYYAEKLPEEKLELIEKLSKDKRTAMVGDGINDAPALARADVGVSLSDASQAAISSAQVVLLNGKLGHLKRAVGISRHTVLTIRQNLFWAFAYNIVAIPIAAMGFLNPMWGALFMAFSDVVVIGNSIRLKHKKVDK